MKVKNYALCVLVCWIMLVFSGCSFSIPNWQVIGDEELNPIAEMAARRIGQAIAKNANVETINNYCNDIINEDISDSDMQALTLTGLRYLADKYAHDPMLADDLISIIKLLGVDLKAPELDLDRGKIRLLKALITAFQTGINAGV